MHSLALTTFFFFRPVCGAYGKPQGTDAHVEIGQILCRKAEIGPRRYLWIYKIKKRRYFNPNQRVN